MTGKTKDAGYQVGVRKTLDHSLEEVWNFLLSKEGLSIWLGTNQLDKWETGIEFILPDGTWGNIRVFKLYSHIRLSWKPSRWHNVSILQVRTIPKDQKTTVSFHQEHLLNEQQRNEMKMHWTRVLENIRNHFQGSHR